jgi:HEPN domain-containing protein
LIHRSRKLSQSTDFRTLARRRVNEARLLLRGGEWSGAYYVVGYAVECGFKACLSKEFRQYQMPDKELFTKSFTHDIDLLARLASLAGHIGNASATDRDFAANWAIVKDWKETSRYETHTRTQAEEMYSAVTNRSHGVLPWVKKHW